MKEWGRHVVMETKLCVGCHGESWAAVVVRSNQGKEGEREETDSANKEWEVKKKRGWGVERREDRTEGGAGLVKVNRQPVFHLITFMELLPMAFPCLLKTEQQSQEQREVPREGQPFRCGCWVLGKDSPRTSEALTTQRSQVPPSLSRNSSENQKVLSVLSKSSFSVPSERQRCITFQRRAHRKWCEETGTIWSDRQSGKLSKEQGAEGSAPPRFLTTQLMNYWAELTYLQKMRRRMNIDFTYFPMIPHDVFFWLTLSGILLFNNCWIIPKSILNGI